MGTRVQKLPSLLTLRGGTLRGAYVLNRYSRIPVVTQPHKRMNNVFRLVNPVFDRNPYILSKV